MPSIHCNLHILRPFLLSLILSLVVDRVECLKFSYPSFPNDEETKSLMLNGNSTIALGALQVTYDIGGGSMENLYGRILYKDSLKLWSKRSREVGSFNTSFVLRITSLSDPGGEGVAFILTEDPSYIPDKSYGQWLGIVNGTTNGTTSTNNQIVVVEFDTKKNYPEDLDNNHVGVDINNTIYSKNQISLSKFGVNISSGNDFTTMINYNGSEKNLEVFVFNGNDTSISPNKSDLVISMPLDLSYYLPEVVYVGFSASTGNGTQRNCVRSWDFSGTDITSKDTLVPIWVWVISPLGVVVALIIVVIVAYMYRRRIDKCGAKEMYLEHVIDFSNVGPKKYRLEELKIATDNFNPRRELGRGGFGIVYKGSLKGKDVAVKRILQNNHQGRKTMNAEVITIGKLVYKNLVKLFGWCCESNELLLVYEYMPNGSLDNILFSEDKQEQTNLYWGRRYNIVCGVAQALDYLHNGCLERVLHRDIKTSNIMLDSEFNARLGDFGLARMFKLDEKTHYTTCEIVGTRAYMAPEIFHTGQATTQTDIYAFGVLALEVVCGRRPGVQTEDGELSHNIVDWVWELYRREMIFDAVDPNLTSENFDKGQANCVLLLGLACCHPNPHMRPCIKDVLQVLIRDALPPLVPLEKPVFYWPVVANSSLEEEEDQDPLLTGGMLSQRSSLNGR